MFKTRKQLSATAVLIACLSSSAQIALAQEHHSHHGNEPAQLTLNSGKKWATDDNLRQGMSRIQAALAAELPSIHSGKASAEQYGALAKKVNEQVEFIIQNCKLDKDTDAMFHLVVTELSAGAEAMSDQKSSKTRHHGAEKIIHALKNYGAYFEHPGWHELK